MSDPLIKSLEDVRDERSFVAFLLALLDDFPSQEELDETPSAHRYLVGVNGWMNQDLRTFLEAAAAGGGATESEDPIETPEQAWRAAAEILYLGKVYE